MNPQLPSRPASAPAVQYTVTDQVQATEADGQGRPARGIRVHFRTAAGNLGSVFVPDNRYTPENVRAAIVAKAALMDQVSGLTS